jgi:hypothetical protein
MNQPANASATPERKRGFASAVNSAARAACRESRRPRERDRAAIAWSASARRAREPAPWRAPTQYRPAPSSAQTSVVVSASSIASGIAIVAERDREREERLADPAQRLGRAPPHPGREQRVVDAERRGRERHAELPALDQPPCASSETSGVPNTSVPSTIPASRGGAATRSRAPTPVNSTRIGDQERLGRGEVLGR